MGGRGSGTCFGRPLHDPVAQLGIVRLYEVEEPAGSIFGGFLLPPT